MAQMKKLNGSYTVVKRKKNKEVKEVKEVASRHKTQEARRTHCDNELLASNI